MSSLGKHLIADFRGCMDVRIEALKQICLISIKKVGNNIEMCGFKEYNHGYCLYYVLSESHLSVDKQGQNVAIDYFTCGNHDPEKCLYYFKMLFKPKAYKHNTIKR